LASADRSPLVPTAAAFVGGGDWYRSTLVRDASDVCHAARGSRHRYPESDHDERRAADARQLRHQRSRVRDYAILTLVARLDLPSIEGGAAAVGRPRLGRPADRLARQGVPRGQDAAARRCRGGVERLPTPGPPSDRRAARCKCGRAGSAITTSNGSPAASDTQVSTVAWAATSTCLSVAADGTFVIRPNRAKLWAIIR